MGSHTQNFCGTLSNSAENSFIVVTCVQYSMSDFNSSLLTVLGSERYGVNVRGVVWM